MFDAYFDWLRKVNTILVWNFDIQTYHVWQADWSFDWHRSWVAGCQPYEASNDAIAELRDRGILDEVQEQAERERRAEAEQAIEEVEDFQERQYEAWLRQRESE